MEQDAIHNFIVPTCCIVVVCNDVALRVVQITAWNILRSESGFVGRIAIFIFHMLSPKMKQIEIVLSGFKTFQQSENCAIVFTSKTIAKIKTLGFDMRIVQKE